MMLAITTSFLTLLSSVLGAPVGERLAAKATGLVLSSDTTDRPVPDVVARHDRKRPGVIVGAVVGSVVGAFIIAFAILWWRGKGCLDRRRPVTPSPPESARVSTHSARSQNSRVIGRVTHEEGWHHLPNPTVPGGASGAPSFKSARSGLRERDALAASSTSLHSAHSSPRKNENRLPYIKASSPSPASPPSESTWKITRPRSVNSFRSAASSPTKEPYIRASSETARETRERRVSLQERLEQTGGLSNHMEDLSEPGARKAGLPLNRKPSFTMMLKNSSRVSLSAGASAGAGAGGYVTTQERLRDQDEEEEARDWTRGMKPLDVDRL